MKVLLFAADWREARETAEKLGWHLLSLSNPTSFKISMAADFVVADVGTAAAGWSIPDDVELPVVAFTPSVKDGPNKLQAEYRVERARLKRNDWRAETAY